MNRLQNAEKRKAKANSRCRGCSKHVPVGTVAYYFPKHATGLKQPFVLCTECIN